MQNPLKTFKQRFMVRAVALLAMALLVASIALEKVVGWGRAAPKYWLVVSAAVGLVYLLLFELKTTALPFLGETVLPPSVLRLATPTESTIDITISAPRRATHVVYWASNTSSTLFDNPADAYAGFTNAGVVATMGGRAVLPLVCPSGYHVPMRQKPLPKHVHYRFVYPDGMLGAVKTQNMLC